MLGALKDKIPAEMRKANYVIGKRLNKRLRGAWRVLERGDTHCAFFLGTQPKSVIGNHRRCDEYEAGKTSLPSVHIYGYFKVVEVA
jgi:hypothetical protein